MFTRYEPIGVYIRKYSMSTFFIAVCLLLFVMDLLPLSFDISEWGAFYPPYVTQGEWYRFVTALFLHGGLMHLASNVLFLYVFGPYVEERLGKINFALFYLLAGIGSFVLPYLLTNVVTIGASGALYGVLAFYMYLFWKEPFRFSEADKQTVWVMVGIGFIISFLTPNVSIHGHASGFIFGFILSPLFNRKWKIWVKMFKKSQ